VRNSGRDNVRLLFVGKTQAGKSALIRALLCQNVEKDEKLLPVTGGRNASSVTVRCDEYTCGLNNCSLKMIDTPGLFDSREEFGNKEHLDTIKSYIYGNGYTIDCCVFVTRFTSTVVDQSDKNTLSELLAAIQTVNNKNPFGLLVAMTFAGGGVTNLPNPDDVDDDVKLWLTHYRNLKRSIKKHLSDLQIKSVKFVAISNIRRNAVLQVQMIDGTNWMNNFTRKLFSVFPLGASLTYDIVAHHNACAVKDEVVKRAIEENRAQAIKSSWDKSYAAGVVGGVAVEGVATATVSGVYTVSGVVAAGLISTLMLIGGVTTAGAVVLGPIVLGVLVSGYFFIVTKY